MAITCEGLTATVVGLGDAAPAMAHLVVRSEDDCVVGYLTDCALVGFGMPDDPAERFEAFSAAGRFLGARADVLSALALVRDRGSAVRPGHDQYERGRPSTCSAR
jgi:hypothetical protein